MENKFMEKGGPHCCLAPCKSVRNCGPSTEPKICSNTNSNFKRPYLGNGMSHLRSAGAKILATLSPSFGLFQSEKALFRGVTGGPHWASLVRICPPDRFPSRKKKLLGNQPIFLPRDFVISFVEVFSLIFTQTA